MDWHWHFYPAIRTLIAGGNPYVGHGLFCPPWVFLLLLPFWRDASGYFYLAFTTVLTTVAVWRLAEEDLVSTVAFMLNPLALGMLWQRNLDWMVVVGLALPSPYSLVFLLSKPHLTALTALWQSRGKPLLIVAILLFCLATVLVVEQDVDRLLSGDWNGATLWPWTIPAGLLIAWLYPTPAGLVAASVFLLPYAGKYSLALALLPLLKRRWWMVAGSVLAGVVCGLMLIEG